MPTIQLAEQKIYYEVTGNGPPLLLMHGWMQVGGDLKPLAKQLASSYRVIVPDLPGYGRSVPPFRRFPSDFYQRDAAVMTALLDALKPGPVSGPAHIMGYSDGGEVALLLGVTRPDLCRSVTAWGATGHFPPALRSYAQQVIAPMQVSKSDRAKHPRQDIARWPAEWVAAFCAVIDQGGDVSLGRADSLRCPLLLMLGDQDRLNPASAGRHFVDTVQAHTSPAQRSSPARLFRLFAQTGHAIHEERAVQFLETVRDFLGSA